jgi:hypothetical protein
MRHRAVVLAVLLSGASFIGSCAQPSSGTETGTGGTTGGAGGKSAGTGGSATTTGKGGSVGSVGTGSGGAPATGGSPATGSSPATGGAHATGGASASGGAPATGGSSATGGSPLTGGSTGSWTGTGGASASGGSTGTGGHAATGTGGHSSTGAGGASTGGAGNSSTGSGGASTGGSTGRGGTSTGGAAGHSSTGSGGTSTSTGGSGPVTGTGGSGSTSSTAAGTIVPLYTDPSDSSWNAIIAAAEAHPTVHVVAIVNPSDGPGSSKSSAYTTGIAALQAAHIEVIGYVATGYGSHSIASMDAEMDQWKSFYPTLQGIFFDEQSNSTSDVAHYQTLSQYAKSLGLSYTVGNPGTDVPAAYIGALDTMLIYESNGVPSVSSLASWSAYAPSNFGVIPYAVSAMNTTFVKQARQYVEYIYLTNDDLPNPWDSLTSYFSDLLAALE